jgi:hypothetical protein
VLYRCSSLPKQDIQAIVKCGCPNKNRKPVNSAKRLREFVQVKEEDVSLVVISKYIIAFPLQFLF